MRPIRDIARDIPDVLLSLAVLAGIVGAELGLLHIVARFLG